MARDATQRFYAEIWPHAAMLLRAARLMGGDADDLVQETLLKAFKAIASLDPDTNPRPWLLTILRNTRVDQLRRVTPELAVIDLDQLADDSASPAATWLNPQEILEAFSDQQMIDALKKLPEEILWTLLLVDVEGIDHAQAAVVLGIPVGTVKSRAFRGRAMLRQILASAHK